MIEASTLCKTFDGICACDQISLTIREGAVFGMIGSNGAGKSTLLRLLCGILKPDSGSVAIDGQPVYETVAAKQSIFYISDEQYYFANALPTDLLRFYQTVYPLFDSARFRQLLTQFGLDPKRKINTFSKGMKKQLWIICGLCSGARYLFCDETFDGLDPMMRQAVKSLFSKEILERTFTPVIASHSLRELEDISDHIGLLHQGGMLLSKDLEEMRTDLHKVQVAFAKGTFPEAVFDTLNVVRKENRGALYTLTLRGEEAEIRQLLEREQPLFFELLPLTLEEIFISETEVVGYDIKKLLY